MEYRSTPRVSVVSAILLVTLTCLACAQQNGDLRLVGGDLVNEGRVEVYYSGQWGTVCDDSWNRVDADAVCRQLGFGSAVQIFYRAKYGQGVGPIHIDQINCPEGAKSILDCNHNGWGVHDCRHSEDAGVLCERTTPNKPSEMPVRLSCPEDVQNGLCNTCSNKMRSNPGDCQPQVVVQGVVETFYNGQWKPVSLDGWNTKSARVVCSELGFPEAYRIPPLDNLWSNWNGSYCSREDSSCTSSETQQNTNFRQHLTSTWLKELDCTGGEGRLLDCHFREFGPHNNPSLRVATVGCGFRFHSSCQNRGFVRESYRTRGSAVPWSGRLEVRVNGEWGTVCDREFDIKEANIACRAMGYGSAKSVQRQATHGRGVGAIHYSQLRCNGAESYLADCNKGTGTRACDHGGDVSVTCNVPAPCNDNDKVSRLVPVPDSHSRTNDFVEVKGPNGWGLLCADSLDANSATVICRENKNMFSRGIRSGNRASYVGVRYNKGTVECNGEEDGMNMCSVFVVEVESCPRGDAIVDCTESLPDLVPDVSQFQTSLETNPYLHRIPMYYLRCAKEEECLASSAEGQPYNHYRSLLRFNSLTYNWGTADFRPILDRSQWLWHQCHHHYHSFEAFIHYDILNKATGEKVAEGHKASFCLEDSLCDGGVRSYRCGTGQQGIAKNCGDLYGSHLDCQWIDVTDVPPGTYLLRQHVNPDKLSQESDYRNNVVSCDITLLPYRFTVTNFKLSDH